MAEVTHYSHQVVLFYLSGDFTICSSFRQIRYYK